MNIKWLARSFEIKWFLPVSLYSSFKEYCKEYFNSNLSLLSNRENEIVLLLAKGFKRKQIALSLGLSPKTIDTYIDRLKKKSNVLNKNQLMQVILG